MNFASIYTRRYIIFSTLRFLRCSVLKCLHSQQGRHYRWTPRQSLTQPRTSQSCETWAAAAWTQPGLGGRIHKTPFSVWFVTCKRGVSTRYTLWASVWAFLILSLSLVWRCWCVCCGRASVWSLVWAGGWVSSHLTYKRGDWSLIQIF